MRHKRQASFAVFAAALISTLAALGVVAATAQKPAHADVSVSGCGGARVYLTDPEKRMLDLHNKERHNRGLPALCVDPTLQRAAKDHSKEMIDKGYFSHDSYDGESARDRLTRYGYDWSSRAENIGRGTGSYGEPDYRFQSWMNSSGHRGNILSSRYKEVGIGEAYGTYKSHSGTRMWTVDFATRK